MDKKWLNYREGTYTNFAAGLEPDGFKEIKWGQRLSTVLGMKEDKTYSSESDTNDFYKRDNEDLTIKDARINRIVYFFPEGRFCAAFAIAHGIDNFKALRKELIDEYGNNGAFTESICFWFGYRCVVKLRYEASSDLVILEINHHKC